MSKDVDFSFLSIPRISAGELRATMIPVPEDIPDHATIPIRAIKVSAGGIVPSGDGFNMTVNYEFLEPFEWIKMDLTIPAKEDTGQ